MRYLCYNVLVVFLAVSLVLTGCKKAPQDAAVSYKVNKDFYKGPLRVQVSLEKEKINLADLLNLKLTAQIDPGNEIHFPAMADLKDFRLRITNPQTRKLADNGKITVEQMFELEPLKTGSCQIPALILTFGQVDSLDELTTEPLTIEVASSLPPDAPLEIADIEDIVELPPLRWPLWAAGAAAAIGAIALILWMRQPPKPAAVARIYRSAHDIALEMLHALAAEKLIEQGRVTEFYHKLSGCLRRYIENRFALRAPELTTEEFLAQLSASDALQPDHKRQLRQFLEHCDLVKFARYQPTNEQIRESLTMAEKFIENTRSPEHIIDVTDARPDPKQ